MKKYSILITGALIGLLISSMTFAVGNSRFSDVPNNHFALEAIEWAADEGLFKGDDGANTFRPDDPMNRGEMAVVLQRYDHRLRREFSPKKAFFDEIEQLLDSGATIEEVENPKLEMPLNVYDGQIVDYFQLGNLYFAPVLEQPYPGTSEGTMKWPPHFVGMLIAQKGDARWTKLMEIKDVNPDPYSDTSRGNAPYYLWQRNAELMLSIVDVNGGGSTEGVAKVFSTQEGWDWQLEHCYYFGPNENYPEFGNSKDVYKLSSLLHRFTMKDLETCKDDVELILL